MTTAAGPSTQALACSPPSEELLVLADCAAIVASLARGMAHDLRGPLQTLTLLVDPHADFFGGPDGAKLRSAVADAVQKLTETIANFGQVYDPADLEPAPIIADELLRHVAELQRYQRGLVAVEIELRLARGLPPVRAVEFHLRHLLLGLITNAKHALAGREDGRIVLGATLEGGEVRLTVEGNGPGVAAGERERIFETARSTRDGAMEIGLTVARVLAERDGGRLVLEESDLGGIRAVVTLPGWGGGS